MAGSGFDLDIDGLEGFAAIPAPGAERDADLARSSDWRSGFRQDLGIAGT